MCDIVSIPNLSIHIRSLIEYAAELVPSRRSRYLAAVFARVGTRVMDYLY